MISNNEYRILGVNKNEDMSTIKIAFRKLASKYHPDKNQDDIHAKQLFMRIKSAYEKIMEFRKNG